MKELYDRVSKRASKTTTQMYSTSFSLGIRFLSADIRDGVYAIYGLVRFADEIVDTFHEFDKRQLLDEFWADTRKAVDQKISLNPILNSFQWAYHKYNLEWDLVDTFFKSMEMDLDKAVYDQKAFENYILGSAEVVGLMCLHVFLNGDKEAYTRLKPNAMALGSAFQKINFLRDLNADFEGLGRSYFPGFNLENPCQEDLKEIIVDIEADFQKGYEGIVQLPKKARFGVYMAYIYYYRLLQKIRKTPLEQILSARIRISNERKYRLFVSSYLRHQLNII